MRLAVKMGYACLYRQNLHPKRGRPSEVLGLSMERNAVAFVERFLGRRGPQASIEVVTVLRGQV